MIATRTPAVITTAAGTLGYAPKSPYPQGPADALVKEAVNALSSLDAATATVTSNAELSLFGQVAALLAPRKDATIRVGKTWEQLQSYSASLNARETELLAVPEPSAADALIDQEVRTRLDAVEATKRNATLALAERGQASRIALALARSPFSGEPLDTIPPGLAEKAWAASARAAVPAAFETLDAEMASVEWATVIIQRVAALVELLSTMPMGSGAGLSVKHLLFDNGLRTSAFGAWQLSPSDWANFVRQQTGQA